MTSATSVATEAEKIALMRTSVSATRHSSIVVTAPLTHRGGDIAGTGDQFLVVLPLERDVPMLSRHAPEVSLRPRRTA